MSEINFGMKNQLRQPESYESRSIFQPLNYIKFYTYCTIQESSKNKMKWAIGAYERWCTLRNQIHSARHTTSWTKNNWLIQPIHEVAACEVELKCDVCDFIVEIRKENGDQYPSGSLYDLLQGLSMFLECKHRFENKLMSRAF